MAETPPEAPPVQFSVRDLATNTAFHALPAMDKRAIFDLRAKNDPEFQAAFPTKGAQEVAFEHIIRAGFQQTSTTPPPNAASPEQIESFNQRTNQAQATQEPTTTGLTPDPAVTGFIDEMGKTAGKGIVKGVQDVASLPGMLLSNSGYTPDPSFTQPGAALKTQYPLQPVGDALQRYAHAPEMFISGKKEGFAPSPPGYDIVEHMIRSATGAAATTAAMDAVMPLLQAGVPLTRQIIAQVKLAITGAVAGETVKAVGGSPWMQATAELGASGLSVKEIRALYNKLLENPRPLKFIAKSAERQPNYAANVAEGQQIEALTGAKLSTPELSRDPTAAAGYQYLKQQDPTFHTMATTAEQQKLEALSTATSHTLQGGTPRTAVESEVALQGAVDTIKAPVRTAQSEVTTSQNVLQAASAAKRNTDAQALMHQSDAFTARVYAEDRMLTDLDAIQQRQYNLKDVDTTTNQQAAQEIRDLRVKKTQILNDAQDTMLADLDALNKRRIVAQKTATTGNVAAVDELYNIKIEHQDILETNRQLLQLQLNDLQKRKYDLGDAARLGDKEATAALQEINNEHAQLLENADKFYQSVVQKTRSYNKLLTTTQRNLEDELTHTTALNKQDTARAQSYASFDAMQIAPTGTTPGTAVQLQKLRARKQQLTATVQKGNPAAQKELDALLEQEERLKAGNVNPERSLAALPPDIRMQTGFEALTEQGSTASVFQQTVAQRTEAVAKKQYGAFYRQFPELDKPVQPFLNSLDALENRVIGRTQESYIPDPTINDIKQSIFQKAHQEEYKAIAAGTLRDENDVVAQLPHNEQGNPQTLEEFLRTKGPINEKIMKNMSITIEEAHGFRSRVLTELRNLPQDSPRRHVLQGLANVTSEAMEDIARQSPEAYLLLRGGVNPTTGKQTIGLDPWYAREIQRGTANPGHYILQRDPATGQLLHPPDVIADLLFSQGPTAGKPSIAASTNLQNFKTHMKNIDETIAEGYIRQDYDLVAQAREAKKAVLDTARTKFYIAAHDPVTGAYLPDKAQEWIRDYYTVLQSNPDLVAIFKNQQTRLHAISEVEAITEGRIADLQEYQVQLTRAHQTAQDEGGTAVFDARNTQTEARRNATASTQEQRSQLATDTSARQEQNIRQERQLTADKAETQQNAASARRGENRRFTDEQYRLVTEKIARGDALSTVEQSIADEARTVRGSMRDVRRDVTGTELTTRQRLAEEKAIHGNFVTSEERQLAGEALNIRKRLQSTRRSLEDIRLEDRRLHAMYTESERVAAENLRAKNVAYDSAIEEYSTTFQGRQAALESLKDNTATQILGARPQDIVTEIEAMSSQTARNRAYIKILHANGSDPVVRDTLLYSMWQESLSKTGTKSTNLERQILLPNAETAAQFIAEREDLLSKIAPEYLANLKVIQAGFERVAELENPLGLRAPNALTKTPIEMRQKIDLGVGTSLGIFGIPLGIKIPYQSAVGYVASDLLVRRHDARKIAAMRDMYLRPEKAREAAQLFSTTTAPAMRRAALVRLLTHTPSAIGASAAQEPQ